MKKEQDVIKIHRAENAVHVVSDESILYATRKHRKLKFTTIK